MKILKYVTLDHKTSLKGIVHPKIKIRSSFTHPQVVPNLYGCLCSAEHKGRYSEECGNQSSSGAPLTIDFSYYGSQWCPKTIGYKLSSKYLPLCSAEQRHSYRFGTTWGWVNDDRIFIFGWTIPLSRWGIFVAIAKNTLYGSKLSIFLLCQKSLGY